MAGHRHSIRLKGYDYSQKGAYFVTVCTQNREKLFGEIIDGVMKLNDAGMVAQQCWNDIPSHFPHAISDLFVVMPNHIHGILIIGDRYADGKIDGPVGADIDASVGAKNFSPLHTGQRPRGTSKTVGSIIRGFKIGVTKWMRRNTSVEHVWQRNYYEHIVRNKNEMAAIRKYIIDNPLKWEIDRENPDGRNE
ncbi:MAG: hypothetical protein JEZ11_04305 [Desulfobacterales bacterium]|nr:hypothetical protein [Desulfobacterales bacterium]